VLFRSRIVTSLACSWTAKSRTATVLLRIKSWRIRFCRSCLSNFRSRVVSLVVRTASPIQRARGSISSYLFVLFTIACIFIEDTNIFVQIIPLILYASSDSAPDREWMVIPGRGANLSPRFRSFSALQFSFILAPLRTLYLRWRLDSAC
jgi:hypothetical protein